MNYKEDELLSELEYLKIQSTKDREILDIALKFLEYKLGCPADSKFLNRITCETCSEDQEIWECWQDFLPYWQENEGL